MGIGEFEFGSRVTRFSGLVWSGLVGLFQQTLYVLTPLIVIIQPYANPSGKQISFKVSVVQP